MCSCRCCLWCRSRLQVYDIQSGGEIVVTLQRWVLLSVFHFLLDMEGRYYLGREFGVVLCGSLLQ